MPRFVLLYHECPPDYQRPSHWDLMLEDGGVLRTWAVTQLPRDWQSVVEQSGSHVDTHDFVAATNTVPAEQLPDHRLDYLDDEGPLSGERGTVTRIESGKFSVDHASPDRWEVTLTGRFLRGWIVLSRALPAARFWVLIFEPRGDIESTR